MLVYQAADEDEDLLITIPAVRGLIELAGVTLGGNQQSRARSERSVVSVKSKVGEVWLIVNELNFQKYHVKIPL